VEAAADLESFLAADEREATDAVVAPLATRTFQVEEPLLGQGSRFVEEGGVAFLGVRTYHVTLDDFGPLAKRRIDGGDLRLVLLRFRFMLRELPPKRQYVQVRVRITLDGDPPVFHLHPLLQSAEVESVRDFSTEVRPVIPRLLQIDFKRSSGESTTRTERRPVATGVDLGADGFGWVYEAQDGIPLVPHLEQPVAVVELPAGSGSRITLTGRFDAEAVIARSLLGVHESRKTVNTSPAAAFRLDL
jgi:hypothetical protein